MWIKRNWIALATVAVLLPATALVIGGNEWRDYTTGRPVDPIMPDASGQISLGDTHFSLLDATLMRPQPETLPEGVRAVEVTVHVEPANDGVSCSAPTLVETSTGREWSEASLRLVGASMPQSLCAGPGITVPYELRALYAVPEGAQGPFTIDVVIAEELPSFARLPLPEDLETVRERY